MKDKIELAITQHTIDILMAVITRDAMAIKGLSSSTAHYIENLIEQEDKHVDQC